MVASSPRVRPGSRPCSGVPCRRSHRGRMTPGLRASNRSERHDPRPGAGSHRRPTPDRRGPMPRYWRQDRRQAPHSPLPSSTSTSVDPDLTGEGVAPKSLIRRHLDQDRVGGIESVEGSLEHADRSTVGSGLDLAQLLSGGGLDDLANPDRVGLFTDHIGEQKRKRSSGGFDVVWMSGAGSHGRDSTKTLGDTRNRIDVVGTAFFTALIKRVILVRQIEERDRVRKRRESSSRGRNPHGKPPNSLSTSTGAH